MFAPSIFISQKIYESLELARTHTLARNYFGMSSFHACHRQRYYAAHQVITPDFDGRKLAIFEEGHRFEEWFFNMVGTQIKVLTEDPKTRKQFAFSNSSGHIRGHCDALIFFENDWVVGETKALNDRSFIDTKAKGVRLSKPLYYLQMILYLYYARQRNPNIKQALFIAYNKNTSDFYEELVNADDALAAREIAATEDFFAYPDSLPPRAYKDPSNFFCKSFCDYSAVCWHGKAEKINQRCSTCTSCKPDMQGTAGAFDCIKRSIKSIPIEVVHVGCEDHTPRNYCGT